MKHLRKLFLAISLAAIVAGKSFAGETSTPPCANPGETSTPPCTSAQVIIDEASEASSIISSEVNTIFPEAVSYAIETLLTLF